MPPGIDASRLACQPFVEIVGAYFRQLVDLVLKEVVGAGDDFMLDHDAFLGFELGDERVDGLGRRHCVLFAIDEQTGRRTGGEEREIIVLGERRYRYESGDLRPSHEKLHRYPGSKRNPGDPADFRLPVVGLQPIESRGRIGKLAGAVLEHALAAADPAKIETQDRETALRE